MQLKVSAAHLINPSKCTILQIEVPKLQFVRNQRPIGKLSFMGALSPNTA